MLYEQIQADYIQAMKTHETWKKEALNYVFSQCKNKKIELQKEPEDADIIALLKKEVKAREESTGFLKMAGKQEEAEQEEAVIAFLTQYLPAMLTLEQTKELVLQVIKEQGIEDVSQRRGDIMKSIMATHKAVVDGKVLQEILSSM